MRETETTLKKRFDEPTEVVMETATRHVDDIFDEVKAAVEGLDWKVQGHTNEIWWLMQGLPFADHGKMVSELVADIESRLRKNPRPGAHQP